MEKVPECIPPKTNNHHIHLNPLESNRIKFYPPMDRCNSKFEILGGKISFYKFIDASNIDMFWDQ